MASACALAIFSGKIIFYFGIAERLRTLRYSLFTKIFLTQKGCRTQCAAAFCLFIRLSRLASLHDDALAGHLGGNGQADIGQHGGCDIGKAAALAQLHVTAANCHKGHNVGSVGGDPFPPR